MVHALVDSNIDGSVYTLLGPEDLVAENGMPEV
jgi:hypothetical protein